MPLQVLALEPMALGGDLGIGSGFPVHAGLAQHQ